MTSHGMAHIFTPHGGLLNERDYKLTPPFKKARKNIKSSRKPIITVPPVENECLQLRMNGVFSGMAK